MKTCPVCEKVLTDQAKFCYFCGASLLDDAAEVIASPTKPEPDGAAEPFAAAEPAPEPETFSPVPAEEPAAEEPAIEEPAAEEPHFETPVEAPVKEEPAPDPVESKPSADAAAAAPTSAEPTVLATDSRSLMTTVAYFFTTLLFHVPVVGLVFMIVWGCGKTKNISLKRFSLAFLIMRLICYIIVLACTVFLLICFSGVIQSLYDAVVPILFP
jgi:hypothetical protein